MGAKIRQPPLCAHCPRESGVFLTYGRKIYPHRPDLFNRRFWYCVHCGAYVGCHRDSIIPLGRPANFELRKARYTLHKYVDPLWKEHGLSRNEVYHFIRLRFDLTEQQAHIGYFSLEMCSTAFAVFKKITPQEIRDFIKEHSHAEAQTSN